MTLDVPDVLLTALVRRIGVAACAAALTLAARVACTGPQHPEASGAVTAEATAASASPATRVASRTAALSPAQTLGDVRASAMDAGAVAANCTMAQLSPSNTAAANVSAYLAAATTALASTMGNVCLPGGTFAFATVRLTTAHSGLHTIGTAPTQTFIHNQPSLGYSLTGGTILKGAGPGSGPAFTFVGAGGAAARWASGFLTDVSFENIGFDSWDRQFLFGGTSLQGVAYSKFNHLYGTDIGVRAYDFINSASLWMDELFGYFPGSGIRLADDLDNSVYGSTTNSYAGNLQFTLTSFAAEGIVLEATAIGTDGSQLNEIEGGYWFVQRPGQAPQSQAVQMSVGSPTIGVSGNAYLPVGMPVGFTTGANGFVAGETYFVVASSATSIQVSNTYGGPPVAATGSVTSTILSVGAENIALRGLGVETSSNAGSVSNVHIAQVDSENSSGNCIFLQGVSGADIVLAECPAITIAGVALRDVNGVTITNSGSDGPTRDADGYGHQDNTWIGAYMAPDVQSDGFLGQGEAVNSSGSVGYHLALAPTLAGVASPGLTVRGTGGDYLYSDFGIGQPYFVDGNYNANLNPSESGIFAYAGPGGTCTLPAIENTSYTTSIVGLPYWFTNVGSGPCKLVTQAAQTFSGMVGATSITVPVGGTVAVSAEPFGSAYTWHVLSFVQPSQVRYGTLSLPTTTVASLPACGAGQVGLLYSVSDARSPTYNAPVAGGGSASIPVFCNGTSWTAH
jgi:hypothetical protein